MAWARLDDGWHDHPKVIAAGLDGAGAWAMCLTWAHANRRNNARPGHIPKAVLGRFAGAKASRIGKKLVEVGLFDATEDGWMIHDFTDYLPKYDPAQAAEAGKKGAGKRWAKAPSDPPPDGEPLSKPPSEPLSGARPDGRSQNDNDRRTSRKNNGVQSSVQRPEDETDILSAHPPDQRGYARPDSEPPCEPIANRWQTHGTRASVRRNPVPVPTDVGNSGLDVASGDARDTAHTPTGALTALYAAGVPLTDHGRAHTVIARALETYSTEKVRAGIGRLIAEQRTCTPDTLRIAILGDLKPANWQPERRRTATEKAEGWLTIGLEDDDRSADPPHLRALPGGAS